LGSLGWGFALVVSSAETTRFGFVIWLVIESGFEALKVRFAPASPVAIAIGSGVRCELETGDESKSICNENFDASDNRMSHVTNSDIGIDVSLRISR
jgi:hypothetical protein